MLYGAGLRVSEALNLTLPDVDTSAATLQIRDSKNGTGRTIPITVRLAATLHAYIAAAHPAPEPRDHVFYSMAVGRPINQSTVYLRFRGYLADADIPHFTGGPHPHSLRHGFAVANLRRWAAANADLAVMLPYLACYMGHADLRGTQYYLRLTADAYPEVIAKAQVRFGYVIPAEFITEQFAHTRRMGAYQPSSLVDYLAGRAVEVEAIWGEPLRRAQAAGVAMPHLERLYGQLKRLTTK